MKTVLQIIGALGIFKYTMYLYNKHHKKVQIEEINLSRRFILFKDYKGKFVRSSEIFEKLLQDCSPFIKVTNQVKIAYDDPEIIIDPEEKLYIVGVELEDEEQQKLAKKIIQKNKSYSIAEIPENTYLMCQEDIESIGETPLNLYIEDIIFSAFYSILHSKRLDDKGQFIEKQIYDQSGKLQLVEISQPIQFRIDKYINHPLIIEKIKKKEEEERKRLEKLKKLEEAKRLEEAKKQKKK